MYNFSAWQMQLEVNALVLILLLTFVNGVSATEEEFERAEPGDVPSFTYEINK